ncbi:NIF3-like protein 1 [Galendromus occidentalis]|uniref:NIF3-like protein 1 n=1 Tax=Galendromus occidentalis TaxID=34638 RepID=A0AAJ6QSW2_9ACAR|nr:NIF3-like protein 1 [Galendromus occidentalis]
MELQRVVQVLRRFAPLELAESWDNVGLLLEPSNSLIKKVFLTNDLTERVMEEAIAWKANMIISYHPPIFSAFKRLDQSNWRSRIVIKCLENRIALYSPHTSWDCVKGGVNDWLGKAFSSRLPSRVDFISPFDKGEGISGGPGRVITLEQPIDFKQAINLVKSHLKLTAVRTSKPAVEKSIKTIGLCAGSGSAVLQQAHSAQPFDLLVTGGMGHHDALEAVHQGSYVILSEHSDTERGFLHDFKEKLRAEVPELEVTVSVIDEDPMKTDGP